MDPRSEPIERAKAYQLVVQQIKAEILEGRLRPGDRLPGERQFSELLQVSRPSVREAIRSLEAMEIVRSRPGTGPESGLIVTTAPSRALSDLLRLHVALSSYSMSDVLQVRLALEEQSVRRLAEEIEQTDTSKVRETLERMSEPGLDRDTFHDLDTEFHVELARCSNNALLADLMAALRDAVRRPMAEAFDNDPNWAERVNGLITEHAEIFAAVCSGDAERAAALMRQHIGTFYGSLGL